MAHFKRRRPRTISARRGYSRRNASTDWLHSWPRWWGLVFHIRPHRRRTRKGIVQVMQGRDPDNIVWPIPNRPHLYYW